MEKNIKKIIASPLLYVATMVLTTGCPTAGNSSKVLQSVRNQDKDKKTEKEPDSKIQGIETEIKTTEEEKKNNPDEGYESSHEEEDKEEGENKKEGINYKAGAQKIEKETCELKKNVEKIRVDNVISGFGDRSSRVSTSDSGSVSGEDRSSRVSTPDSGSVSGEDRSSRISTPDSGFVSGEDRSSRVSTPDSGSVSGEDRSSRVSTPDSGPVSGEDRSSRVSTPDSRVERKETDMEYFQRRGREDYAKNPKVKSLLECLRELEKKEDGHQPEPSK